MRLLDVPARQGTLWVRRGVSTFLRAPVAFALLLGVVVLAAIVLSLLPVAGVLLMLAAQPLVSLGFMVATREVLDGHARPTPRVFIEPLRGGRARALLQLGGAYAALVLLILVLANAVSSGQLADLGTLLGNPGTDPAAVEAAFEQPGVDVGLLLAGTLLTLVSLTFWHAPALVYWDGQGAGQALFSSTLACWRAKAAFTLYGLAWIGLSAVISWILLAIFALLGNPMLAAMAMVPVGLLLQTAFYVSLYFTFADSFIDTTGDPVGSTGLTGL